MPIHEKIKFVRQLKGWSQEAIAEKLHISLNAYGNIERGDSDVKLSRLEQIAQLFNVTLAELLNINEQHFINQAGSNNIQKNFCVDSNSPEYQKLQIELDKQKLINEHNDKEINMKNAEIQHLNKIVALLEKQDR